MARGRPKGYKLQKVTEYAIYIGDEFQFTGTAEECAARLGVKPETVQWYATESYRKRMENAKFGDPIVAVNVGRWEQNEENLCQINHQENAR
ncbi:MULTISPECIES: hypothetical protein [Oceanobacillus]|uniref:Phage protein n=1 Tax=Oceanobacillus aidingensis TaxID=645964 RepID=A0ABV9JVI7_9BACI